MHGPIAPVESVRSVTSAVNLRRPFQLSGPPPGGPGLGPLGVEGRFGTLVLECKDRSEFGSVILPFIGCNAGNCV
jgi:hypothetical protein